MASHRIKFQSVALEVQPWKHPSGRDYWRAYYHHPTTGKRLSITRAKLADAKRDTLEKAIELARGTVDFNSLPLDTLHRIKRLLDVDPGLELADEYLVWRSKRKPQKLLGEALDEFIAAKEANRGRSAQNVKTLKSRLSILDPLRDRIISEVKVSDLQIPASLAPRTRKNVRGSIVTFFRWCQDREYLPHGEKTAAERIEKPISQRKIPDTYTPEELAILLGAVSPKFLPWLACGAFAGIRTDEVYPMAQSDKTPLDWSDFHWSRSIIIMRPETDKNGHRRVIPILPALRHWLYPVRKKSGPLVSCLPSSGNEPETKRLGGLIGGWKPNALRHSFISYRAALVGLGQTAMEAGNSESEAKKSYNDAKGKDEARRWFGVRKCSQDGRDAMKRGASKRG